MAERSYPTSKVRGGSQEDPMPERLRPGGATLSPRPGAVEERSHPTSKEQWLHFDGAAVKRYPTSKVRETQVRW